ncbi:MAG: hypothetical protein EA374_05010 [Acholeplasmatales bacterium]|nr:MAG: hypothetical protein EA374_05010 [Acholeplasmatales bacterium]
MKTRIDKTTRNGLEVLTYRPDTPARLLFLQHGIRSKKDSPMQLLGVSLARLGYEVVGIDAYKHGSRAEEPFKSGHPDLCELATMEVVERTAQEIEQLYAQHYQDRYASFDIVGVSMGGLIAYLLSTLTNRLDTLVALISSPRFLEAAEHTFPPEKQVLYPEETAKSRAKVIALDPSSRPDAMQYRRLIMLNGADDPVIPASQSESFLLENPHRNILFQTFPTAHKISVEMHEALLSLLSV